MRDRMIGLLRTDRSELGDGLLIEHSPSIHMFFMGYAIDAVFLDKELRVVRVVADLAPWKVAGCRGARSVIELWHDEPRRHAMRNETPGRHEQTRARRFHQRQLAQVADLAPDLLELAADEEQRREDDREDTEPNQQVVPVDLAVHAAQFRLSPGLELLPQLGIDPEQE